MQRRKYKKLKGGNHAKSICLLLALFLTLLLNIDGNTIPKAHAGDYIGTMAFEFLTASASPGPLMQCETTYVGGHWPSRWTVW